MHMTPSLTNIIENAKNSISEHEFRDLVDEIQFEIERVSLHLQNFNPGIDRAQELHRLLEIEMEATANLPVTCSKGCGFCCHLEVQITADEAERLKARVQAGLNIDRERLKELSERKRNDPLWRAYNAPMNRCVFLSSENSCRVYEDRPSACRKLLVSSNPNECSRSGGDVLPLKIPRAEIVISAALSIDGARFGSLPQMLQMAFDQDVAQDTHHLFSENEKHGT